MILEKFSPLAIGLSLFVAGCSGDVAGPGVAAANDGDDGGVVAITKVSAEDGLLTIGSPAPALDIEHWVQDGGGQFKPVTAFAKDQVYVVEFWATWCPPCVASMPHLSKLQQDYAKRGVTIVSVSDEPLETVTGFLEREADGQTNGEGEPVTFNDITKHYCLTTDPDRSTSEDYMEAAKQNGIPCAFVVGKDGRVEWIGHPMELDDPLEEVVAGTWDREAFGEVFRARQRFEAEMQEVMLLARGGDAAAASEKLDQLIADAPPELAAQAKQAKLQIEFFAFQGNVANDQAAAITQFGQLIELVDGDQQIVNVLAWAVVQQADRGEVTPELLQTAADAAEKVVDTGDASASLIDTLAHLVYYQGDLDRAIEWSRTASEKAEEGQLKEAIDAYLEQLEAEKASKAEAGPEGDGAEK